MMELLSVEEMSRADRFAIAAGIPGERLMENAGAGVATAIMQRFAPRPVLVLCGPGNNGGDGFVVARRLVAAGWPVRLALLGPADRLKGDAALMAKRWQGPVEGLAPALLDDAVLVVDALFGAGLERPIEGLCAELIGELNRRRLDVVAIDLPSGISGDSGAVRGIAPQARLTVTFFRKKPGHLLLPGREHCGEVEVVDIGIPPAALEEIKPRQWENAPALWLPRWPGPGAREHKYARGHALVVSGPGHATGAARLAARAALRVGAGLVTIAAPPDAVAPIAAQVTSIMIAPFAGIDGFRAALADGRRNAILLGPGNGVGPATRALVEATLAEARWNVLDADALSVFKGETQTLARLIRSPTVLTPHDGEFARLFRTDGDKLRRVRRAAIEAGAVVLLKGADTTIAAPDGRAVINANAPADLATAGSGDVLAGLVAGLLAQKVPAFEAACAAAWLHGAAARAFGPGLIAEDLPEMLPRVLRALRAR
ncbi:MAG: NAD(P)H-hydrate dehydratase [Alphaproteobacteria bacterium]|nr:NAD(P)H-hydrate dehydratase [Alphaproteobacteria bacterium]